MKYGSPLKVVTRIGVPRKRRNTQEFLTFSQETTVARSNDRSVHTYICVYTRVLLFLPISKTVSQLIRDRPQPEDRHNRRSEIRYNIIAKYFIFVWFRAVSSPRVLWPTAQYAPETARDIPVGERRANEILFRKHQYCLKKKNQKILSYFIRDVRSGVAVVGQSGAVPRGSRKKALNFSLFKGFHERVMTQNKVISFLLMTSFGLLSLLF